MTSKRELIELYPFPRYPDDIVYEGGFASQVGAGEIEGSTVDNFTRNINELIDEHLEEVGLKEKHPEIDSSNTRYLPVGDRGILQLNLRKDSRVFENAMEIIKATKPELFNLYRPKELYSFIGILDWNASDKSAMDDVYYKRPKLVVQGLRPLHSYVVQLTRGGHPMPEIDSPSVSGIVTIEHKEMGTIFPIGYRAGSYLPNTAMTIPAGSVKIPKVDKRTNPIFDTFYNEMEMELGACKVFNERIIGHHFDPYVGGNTLFVVLADSMLDKEETSEAFEHAKERYQHDRLMWKKFNPRDLLMDIVMHDLPYDKNNLPKVPDEKVPYLYPLKQSLVALMAYISAVRSFSYRLYQDPSSVYPIKHKM